jgi:ABC-2 type transport system ATP-binding protein
MDEAERCHRLASIFSGTLMDVGTPDEIIDRRHLHIVEFEPDRRAEAEEALRADPRVEEIAHYGAVFRVTVRGNTDPISVVREIADKHGIRFANLRQSRPSVEDAFVSMVRQNERAQPAHAAQPSSGAPA